MAAETTRDDAALRQFRKVHPAWPTFMRDSIPRAEKAWLALSEEDRAAAAERMADYVETTPKGKLCTFAVYLAEKRWERLPPPGPKAPSMHPHFGKAWTAMRLATLLGEPAALPPLTVTLARMVEQGGEMAERILRQHRERWGWPIVNRMDEQAALRRGYLVPQSIADLGADFRQVRVGSALWDEWRDLHGRMGWPWLPDTGRQEWVWFPAADESAGDLSSAVDAALSDFLSAVSKGRNDDAA